MLRGNFSLTQCGQLSPIPDDKFCNALCVSVQDHLKAQVSRQEQLLDIMSQRHQELETRLDYMITRIAKETQDIKDLEQQLTDGE